MKTTESIRIERYYEHTPEAIWRVLTDPELHARWWAAGDVRPVVGHKFELDMGAWGKQRCEVLEVEHERLFKYHFAADTLDTTISWHLVPEGEGTLLRFAHDGFDVDSPMGRRAYEGMQPGWPKILARIEAVLGS